MGQEKQVDDIALRSIKLMFEQGEVKRMYDIHKLSPTKIAKALALNHGRYVDKLFNPEKFYIKEIRAFSNLIGVNPEVILSVILKELA